MNTPLPPDVPPDAAPALSRGIAIIRYLCANGASSLERLSGDLALPKSSCQRCLSSLVASGVVSRDPSTKRYRSLFRLSPCDDGDSHLREAAAEPAAVLASQHPLVIEVYGLRAERPYMIDRVAPELALDQTLARIGHERTLDEIEALTQVVQVFGSGDPKAHSFWRWSAGTQHILSRAEHWQLLAQCATSGLGRDPEPNPQMVRRLAAPILVDEVLRGLIAGASAEREETLFTTFAPALLATAAQIARALTNGD